MKISKTLDKVFIIQMNDGLYSQKAFTSFENALSLLPLKWSCMMIEADHLYEVETGIYIKVHTMEVSK